MSGPLNDLEADGCCAGAAPLQQVWNRPALSRIAYRSGDHAAFRAAMLARLSAADMPALAGLTQRSERDPTIALLDAAAVVADIVTFYNERIASEAWLRTAVERRSLVGLGRLIGYEPAPGLAASCHLAFTLEDAEASLEELAIPAGTRVQSLPPPGAPPAVFETVEAILARPEWNAMRPLQRRPHPQLSAGTERLLVQGLRPQIQKGETILLITGPGPGIANRVVKRVMAVRTDAVSQTTELDLAAAPSLPAPFQFTMMANAVFTLAPLTLNNAAISGKVLGATWRGPDLAAFANIQRWTLTPLRLSLNALRDQRAAPPGTGAFRFTRTASAFGHNAPNWSSLPPAQRLGERVKNSTGTEVGVTAIHPNNWDASNANTLADDASAMGLTASLDLDDRVPEALPGGWAVLTTATHTLAANITATGDVARSAFTLNAKVTRLGLDASTGFDQMRRREVTVRLGSEALPLAPVPVMDVVTGNTIVLDAAYLGLSPGRPVSITGPREDLAGVIGAEVAVLSDVAVVDGLTVLTLRQALRNRYRRGATTINANVALATHGQQQDEAIGSGDARVAFQRFPLRAPPLTYVPAGTASGAASTLEIRVQGELWREVPSFVGSGPQDRVFITYADPAGGTVVQFGDGTTGARPPSGLENIRARYRQGIGTNGLVAAATLSLALVRPAGVRGVTNPEAAADAANPELAEEIRGNAALRIKTLDRVVSLQDYGDMSRAFAGIAKALASWSWDGRARGVFLTLSGPEGRALDPLGQVGQALAQALRAAGDPRVPIRLASYRPAFFRLEGRLKRHPDLDGNAISAAVEAALRLAFGFAARSFGQPVALSEVMAVIHSVPGVLAFDMDRFERSDGIAALGGQLAAAAPLPGIAAAPAAELLLLDPRPLAFGSLA